MSSLELAFIILNACLIGGSWSLVAFITSKVRAFNQIQLQTEAVRDECRSLVKMIGEAHNGLAERLLKIEDLQKGQELRMAQKTFMASR